MFLIVLDSFYPTLDAKVDNLPEYFSVVCSSQLRDEEFTQTTCRGLIRGKIASVDVKPSLTLLHRMPSRYRID